MNIKRRMMTFLLALIVCLSLLPGAALAATSENLLISPDAENGMTGWIDPDGLWGTDDVIDPHSGIAFFWPLEAYQQDTSIYQDVSLSSYSAGKTVILNAWLANYDQSPHDMSTVSLEFINSSGTVLSSDSREQRNPEWQPHTIIRTIPAGAVIARVRLTATWFVGNDVDGYFDDISLVVTDEKYNMVYITGDKETAVAGDTILLIADNSISQNPADYIWSSSYNDVATVDANGKVTYLSQDGESVAIYAQDKATSVTGVYRINSDIPNEKPAVGDSSEWATAGLQKASDLGLIPDSLKGQDLTQNITRAEFAAVAVKTYQALSGVDAVAAVNNPFTDCSDIEVLKAYSLGAVNGTSATTYSPNELLNREQAAAMLTRTFKKVSFVGWTSATDSQFSLTYTMPALFADDTDISSWAKDSVYFMVASGIINGVGDNKFAPKNITTADEAKGYANATREQALLLAVRMAENLSK